MFPWPGQAVEPTIELLVIWNATCHSHYTSVMNEISLTHWGRVTHICLAKLTIIGSDNGLSPGRRQAIIWTNVGILLIAPLGTNFSEILSEIHSISFRKMHLKMASAKWRPFCLGLNVLNKSISSWNLSMLYKWTRPPEAWVMASHLTKIYIGLTVGQFMTCHLCALSHYRNQYWFIVNSTTCMHQAITGNNTD